VSNSEIAELVHSSICAVVVSYCNVNEVLECLRRVRSQIDRVLVVDNGSGHDAVGELEQAQVEMNFDLVANQENRGIAAALNQGLEWARVHEYAWLLTLDQDCFLPEGFVDKLVSNVQRIGQEREQVAVIGPVSGTDTRCSLPSDQSITPVPMLMTGGSLLNVRVALTLNGCDESFFIDYVDYEYCFRCRRNGYAVLRVNDLSLTHEAGTPTVHKVFWKEVRSSNHTALRCYYISRNRFVVQKQYFKSDTVWAIGDAYRAIGEWAKILLFERDPREKTRMMLRGFLDGFHGVSGPYVERD